VIGTLRYRYSKRALRDIANIYNHIFENNPAAAKRFVSMLEGKIISLAASGNSGVSRDWLAPKLRAFLYKDRCIYFRVDAGEMQIVRILHGKQQVSSELFARSDEK
jgi:toxin ParE1/3/4